MARRLRDVLAIAERLEAGESPAQVKSLAADAARGRPTGASRRRARTDADALRRALEALADLELRPRGGRAADDTAALRAIERDGRCGDALDGVAAARAA